LVYALRFLFRCCASFRTAGTRRAHSGGFGERADAEPFVDESQEGFALVFFGGWWWLGWRGCAYGSGGGGCSGAGVGLGFSGGGLARKFFAEEFQFLAVVLFLEVGLACTFPLLAEEGERAGLVQDDLALLVLRIEVAVRVECELGYFRKFGNECEEFLNIFLPKALSFFGRVEMLTSDSVNAGSLIGSDRGDKWRDGLPTLLSRAKCVIIDRTEQSANVAWEEELANCFPHLIVIRIQRAGSENRHIDVVEYPDPLDEHFVTRFMDRIERARYNPSSFEKWRWRRHRASFSRSFRAGRIPNRPPYLASDIKPPEEGV